MNKEEQELYDELAGKYEYDAGYSREQAEVLALMDIEYIKNKWLTKNKKCDKINIGSEGLEVKGLRVDYVAIHGNSRTV